MSESVTLPVKLERSNEFFSIFSNAFILSGPNTDGSLQIVFAEDFGDITAMKLTGAPAPSGQPGVFIAAQPQFEGEPVRVLYGRVKMSLLAAKQLRDALNGHITVLEQTLPPTA